MREADEKRPIERRRADEEAKAWLSENPDWLHADPGRTAMDLSDQINVSKELRAESLTEPARSERACADQEARGSLSENPDRGRADP